MIDELRSHPLSYDFVHLWFISTSIHYFDQPFLLEKFELFRLICAVCLFSLLTGSVYARTRIYVDVPDGDLAALKQAIFDTNTRSPAK